MSKRKLRKKLARLKRENLELIIESNAARARAGEAVQTARNGYPFYTGLLSTTGNNLDG